MKRQKLKKHFTLRQFNNYLSVVILLLSFYVIFAPFWPQAAISLQKDPPLVAQEKSGSNETIPEKNSLVIPKLKLQQEILEGGEAQLNIGVWRTPTTGTPLSSNMVLSGHRFTYGGPAVFYHLDKVKKDDKIIVYWNKKKYRYKVTDTFVVQPNQVEILDPSFRPKLTIYTCTPLWSSSHRLVITADLIGENQ